MKCLILDPVAGARLDDLIGLRALQECVAGGGYVDVVNMVVRGQHDEFVPEDATIWLDDEGLLKGAPLNRAATRIAHHYGAIFANARLVGTIAVSGGVGDEGESLDVPPHVVAELLDVLADADRQPVVVAPTFWEQAAEYVAAGIPVIAVAGPDDFPLVVVCRQCGGDGYLVDHAPGCDGTCQE